MTSPSAYAPWQFHQYNIAFEGASLAGILYGVYLVIAVTNACLLRGRRYRILWSFTLAQLVITTIYMGFSLYAGPSQSLAIFNLSGSSGPDVLSPWPSIVVDCAFVLNTWISDGFLLYRCYVICMGNMYAMTLAAILYLGTIGSSLAWLVYSSTPGAVYSTHVVQVTGIWYWSFSAATNVCVSCVICGRLWMHRRAISRAIGSPQGTFYLGYMAMTLESALLYTAFVVVALVVFTANSPLENVFFPVLGNVQVIAPSLIVYRIARGISFETDEYGSFQTGSIRFASTNRRRTLLPVRQDAVKPSELVRAVSMREAKADRDSSSLIHEIKEDTV